MRKGFGALALTNTFLVTLNLNDVISLSAINILTFLIVNEYVPLFRNIGFIYAFQFLKFI